MRDCREEGAGESLETLRRAEIGRAREQRFDLIEDALALFDLRQCEHAEGGLDAQGRDLCGDVGDERRRGLVKDLGHKGREIRRQ